LLSPCTDPSSALQKDQPAVAATSKNSAKRFIIVRQLYTLFALNNLFPIRPVRFLRTPSDGAVLSRWAPWAARALAPRVLPAQEAGDLLLLTRIARWSDCLQMILQFARSSRLPCRCRPIASVRWRSTNFPAVSRQSAAGLAVCAMSIVQRHLVSAQNRHCQSVVDLAAQGSAWRLAQLRGSA
jgi:hypothetical protein